MLGNAIRLINPEAKFMLTGEDLNDIEWIEGTSPINVSDIEAKMAELQAEYDALQYQRDRQYPPIGDQLDYIYHNGVAKWKTDMIDPVKTKYPKG